MLKYYLQIAFRYQLKNKLFSIINILGLAIGITAAILIMNYVSFEFRYDTFHFKKDRIYRVESLFYEGNTLTDNMATSSFGYGTAMKQEITGIENFVRIALHAREQVVTYKDTKIRENTIAYTEPSFFRIFDFNLLRGDTANALNRPNTVVITQSAAKRYFRNEDPIGKMLRFATTRRNIDCEVTGIVEDFPANSHIRCDFLISYESLPTFLKEFWYMHEVYTYVLLKPAINPKSIEDDFPAMSEKYKTSEALANKKWAISLVPLCNIHLNPQKTYEKEIKGNKRSLVTLIIIAFILLITAWINYVNLTIARSMERAREVGVRKVFGASHWQLIRQYLTESFMANIVAIALSFILVYFLNPYFSQLIGKHIELFLLKEPLFWHTTLIVLLLGIFLSGFYPAFVLSSIKPALILKGKFANSSLSINIRRALVIFQFTASLFLITGTFIVYLQIKFMQEQSLGFDINQTLVLKYPVNSENLQIKVQQFTEEIKAIPIVKSATVCGSVPGMEIAMFASNKLFGDNNDINRLYEMLTVDYDYIKSFNMQLVEGRSFTQGFGDEINNILVNEESVKQLGFNTASEAIGKSVLLEGTQVPCEIIGVVKNWYQRGLTNNYTPIMFIMNGRIGWIPPRYIAIKVSRQNLKESVSLTQEKWNTYFPESSFDYFFLDSFFNEQYKSDRRFGLVFSIFTALAFFISILGLWALASFIALHKVKEVGIRKVLGAGITDILYLFSKEIMILIAVAFVIATPLSIFIMEKWLANFAFRTEIRFWVYIIGGLFAILVAVITVIWQSWKVAKSTPVESLKYE